jgi:hypothetical protein
VWALALVATVGFVSAIYFAFRAHEARLSAAASIAELSVKERELSENSSRAILSRLECHCHTTGQNLRPRNSTEWIQKEKERISTMPFLLSHFSPGDNIENCPAQFLAVCWILRVELSAKPVGDGAVSQPSILAGDAEKYPSDAVRLRSYRQLSGFLPNSVLLNGS